jgi:predicted transcriptional regulator
MRYNDMIKYSNDEVSIALQVVSSTISKCEKMQTKFAEGTSQHTLLKNRIKAMYISKALITGSCEIESYSKEELVDAIRPVDSIISKCETGQRKHFTEAPAYKRFQKIINAMNVAKSLIADEICKRG